MPVPRKYPDELRERSIRFACDLVGGPGEAERERRLPTGRGAAGHPAGHAANWVRQARVDAGAEPGLTTDERAWLRELEREVRELRRANAILKSASAFFTVELDRPSPR